MTDFQREMFFGFDSLFDAIKQPQQQSYPPYNVVKIGDTHFLIELAVAGFKSEDINLTLEKGVLTISGTKEGKDERDYVHKGISTRSFSKNFTLSETIKVVGADIVDGVLLVGLENVIPEEDKPKTINLGDFNKDLLLG